VIRIGTLSLAIALTMLAQNRALAEDAAGGDWKNGACESLVWKKAREDRRKIDAEFGISRTSPPAPDYDNPDTFSALLRRLRDEFGASEPPPEQQRIIDTQFYLVQELKFIANTDQGMYYPRWAAWWEANRQFPRQKWILDGFAGRGLHVVDPVDERFGLELIRTLGSKPGPYGPNALKLFMSAPPEDQAKWIAFASSSGDRNMRLGVLYVLSGTEQPNREDVLRKLARDSDLETRRDALTILNRGSRAVLSARPAAKTDFCRVEMMGKDSREISSVAFAGDLLIVVYRGRVRAFDPQSRREVWTQPIPSAIGEFVLAVGDELILAGRSGALLALDSRGNLLWRRIDNNQIRCLVRKGNDLLVAREHFLEQLDLRTGARKAEDRAAEWILDAAATDTAACLIDESGLRCLDGRKIEFRGGRGISITKQALCLTEEQSFGHGHLICLNPMTLSPLWRAPVQAHVGTPLQDGSRVFVYTNDDLTAFRTSDGSVLWSTYERHADDPIPSDYGSLLKNDDYRLELRDPETGEVRRVWPEMPLIDRIAVHNNFAAIAGRDVLWLVDLSGAADHQ